MTSAGDYDYDAHGSGYARRRRTDPRIAARVWAALGDARTVVNVGAGAGSYEPSDRQVIAVEPSASMRAQRGPDAAPVIAGVASDLPFDDDAVDAAMATITVHHWPDPAAGLAEMRRVARGPVVVLTFDGTALDRLWLGEYVPELFAAEARRYTPIEVITETLGGQVSVTEVPIPIDCVDGFTEAFYARPEAFLDAGVRAGQSAWGFVDADATERGIAALRRDLESGAWDERHGHLRSRPELIGAVRLVVARP